MKLKLSDREKWLLTGVILVGILYGFFTFVYLPKSQELSTLRQQLNVNNSDLKTANAKALLLQNLEEGSLASPRLQKTKEAQMIEALQHLSALISNLDLDLISIKPHQGEIAVDSAKAILLDVEFLGSYSNVFRFMEALEKLPILILIDSATLKRADKGMVSVTALLSVYF